MSLWVKEGGNRQLPKTLGIVCFIKVNKGFAEEVRQYGNVRLFRMADGGQQADFAVRFFQFDQSGNGLPCFPAA